MNTDARQVLNDFLSEASDAACDAVAALEACDAEAPVGHLLALDRVLKGSRIRAAYTALHASLALTHPCCLHEPEAGAEPHDCCLPRRDAGPHGEGEWVLATGAGDRTQYAAMGEQGATYWTWLADPRLLRFKERGFAEIFASWHFKGDVTVRATCMKARAA